MDKTQEVIQAIENNDMAALQALAERDDNTQFFVYKGNDVFFWSTAWLNASGLPFKRVFDKWVFRQWNNSYGICRRTRYDDYFIMVIIPLKYDYRITSDQLQNTFIKPFKGNKDWTLTPKTGDKDHYYPIYSDDGYFLFSLCNLPDDTPPMDSSITSRSYSYRSIFISDDHESSQATYRLHIYYLVAIVVLAILLAVALYWLIRYKGFKNMRLAGKFQLVIISLITIVLISNFILSVVYIRKMFIARQEYNLGQKAQYVQNALQNLYFWDIDLSAANTNSLNIDLRDLCYAYETDIHVYDRDGVLIGSSSPQLFDQGILSRYISPEPFFGTSTRVQYEHVGDVKYLTAYTEFYNGGYVQIGYIALPYFISQDQVNANVENYMIWLLPLYLLLLLISILVIWIIARILSASLASMSHQMERYKLGDKGVHLSYFFNDEVGDLVNRYNEMIDALAESSERLARTERETAWRTMARQVAHEINNSLTPMKLTMQQMQRLKGTERFDDYFQRSTQVLIEQMDNLSKIATSFSSFAKMPEVKPAEVDVAQKLASCVALQRNNDYNIPLRFIGARTGVMAIADPDQISQVFINIIKNALQAMGNKEGSDIIIILKELPPEQLSYKNLDANASWVEISFSDNGPGIPLESRDKVFVPNFTTKSTGMGLGLAIAKNIIDGCNGKICFQTSEKGTTFFVYLRKKQ